MAKKIFKLFEVTFSNGHAVMVEARSPGHAKKKVMADMRNNSTLRERWDNISSIDLVEKEVYDDLKGRWPEAFMQVEQ
jgi:hypothetical protein